MNDTPAGPGDLTTRIEKLERQNRRMRLGVIALGLVVIVALLFDARPAITQPSSAAFGTLKAHAFLLTDQSGETRASLSFAPWGQPMLVFRDAAGKAHATLLLGPRGQPDFYLQDGARGAANLGWGDHGPGLSLMGKGNHNVVLTTWGSGMLSLGGGDATIILGGTNGRSLSIRLKNLEIFGSTRLIKRWQWP